MSLWPSSSVIGTIVAKQKRVVLYSDSTTYRVLEILGEGCFGTVARCHDLSSNEPVAVKILKYTHSTKDIKKEVSILKRISILDPDCINVVKFFEQFEYMGQTCLVFEMLDRSLYDLINRHGVPLHLAAIRLIAEQLFVALDALRDVGVLHTDIKPDNIMLVSGWQKTLRIKVIDFGSAILASDAKPGMLLQPNRYRAPEVSLGLPLTQAIDVWGVGCVLAFLYLAADLFPFYCDYHVMKQMVQFLGQPGDHMLYAGKYTCNFFSEVETAESPAWRLKTPEEYTAITSMTHEECDMMENTLSSLEDLVNIYQDEGAAEFKDRLAFVDLLKRLLHLDGDQRISAHQALRQPFITKAHLREPGNRADTFQNQMSFCPLEDSAHGVNMSVSLPCVYCEEDTKNYLDREDRQVPSNSYDRDPDVGCCDGELASGSCDEDQTSCSAHGTQAGDSHGDATGLQSRHGHNLASCSLDEGLSCCPNNEDPSNRSFEGAESTDCPAAASASFNRRKTLNRMHRLLSRVIASFLCCWFPTSDSDSDC